MKNCTRKFAHALISRRMLTGMTLFTPCANDSSRVCTSSIEGVFSEFVAIMLSRILFFLWAGVIYDLTKLEGIYTG